MVPPSASWVQALFSAPPQRAPAARFKYLTVSGGCVHVDCSARDWCDHDADAHVAYHRLVFKQAPHKFSVHVDATHLPCVASTHLVFFRALCAMARSTLKTRLVSLTVLNAPAFVRTMYRAFVCIGLIPLATQRKITFVDRTPTRRKAA